MPGFVCPLRSDKQKRQSFTYLIHLIYRRPSQTTEIKLVEKFPKTSEQPTDQTKVTNSSVEKSPESVCFYSSQESVTRYPMRKISYSNGGFSSTDDCVSWRLLSNDHNRLWPAMAINEQSILATEKRL